MNVNKNEVEEYLVKNGIDVVAGQESWERRIYNSCGWV